MEPEEEVEPFDWEDYLYESWLEEKREQKRKAAAAGVPSPLGAAFR